MMSFFKKIIPLRAEMLLQLDTLKLEEGKPLKGVAGLESKDNFRVENVRLEIRVEETWKEWRSVRASGGSRSMWATVHATVYSNDVPISESFDMGKGEKKEFPFEVTIPAYQSTKRDGKVSYSLKAVANVKGRPDLTKEVNPTSKPQPSVP